MSLLTPELREQFVRDNLRLAYFIARMTHRYQRMSRLDLEDVEQEAVLGLAAAAQVYDPDEHPNVPFGAFARMYIKRHVFELIETEARHNLDLSLTADLTAPGPDPFAERMALDVWDTVQKLPRREKLLLIRRYGLDGGPAMSLYDLAQHFGESSRTVTRLLTNARDKVEAQLRNKGFTDNTETQEVASHSISLMA